MEGQTVLQQYETLSNKISGILSSRFITNDLGELVEIHILADSSRGPKQISRDIQSVMLAKFNVPVDHKIISIAQIDDGMNVSKDFRLGLKNLNVVSELGKIEAKVVLSYQDQIYEGTAIGGNAPSGRFRIIAEATLNAIHQYLNMQYVFVLADVVRFTISEKKAFGVTVSHISSSGEQQLIGSSLVKQDEHEAIVKATLDAINRRLRQYY